MADDLNEKRILADAIKELAPRDESEMRARLIRHIDGLHAMARGKRAPTPGKANQQLRARLKRMRRVRADLVAIGSPPDAIEMFDRQLHAAEDTLAAVQFGGPQLNDTAACAVAVARELLQSSGRRVRWARWCRLASLLYEGATCETAFDFSKYISKCNDGRITATPLGVMITGTTARCDIARDGTVWITGKLPD